MFKIFKYIFIIVLILLSFILIRLLIYNFVYINDENSLNELLLDNKDIKEAIYDSKSPYCKTINLILPNFLTYKIKSKDKDDSLLRINKTSYEIPMLAFDEADAFISYGIDGDIEYEEKIVEEYPEKNLYAFDCGIKSINNQIYDNLIFKSECIGTDKYIVSGQTSSGKIHTFGQKLKELNLLDKKVHLKMNIGPEALVIYDVLKYSDNLTGIIIAARLNNVNAINQSKKYLEHIEKDFVLVSRIPIDQDVFANPMCNYVRYNIPRTVILSYVNKNLVDKKKLNFIQNYTDRNDYNKFKFGIDWVVILDKKIKDMVNNKN